MENYERQFGDDLCADDVRLKYKWKWNRSGSGISKSDIAKWTHFQCATAAVDKHWKLSSTQWGDGDSIRYEGRISYIGEGIASIDECKTRLDAQIAAEKLLVTWINDQRKLING